MEVLLTSAFSFDPINIRGDVNPGATPLSSLLVLDSRQRLFFSLSLASKVLMDISSIPCSISDPSLKDEWRDVGGDIFAFSVFSG